jgi:hypothetical protein
MDPMQLCNNFIDKTLAGIRGFLSAELFEKTEANINNLAKFATPICALVGALISIILAIKTDSLVLFLASFAWIFFVILLYYIGSKLQSTCQSTINNNPFSIASQDLIDTLIAVNCVGAIIFFIAGFYISIKTSDFDPLILGTVGSLVTIYFVWILLHPHLVTTYVESSTSAGLDAIAYLSLGNKMFLRTNKLLFGLLPSIAAILLFKSLFKVFGNSTEVLNGGIQGAIGFIIIIVGLLSPLIAYLFFIFSYMILDVMRSILVMGSANGKNDGNNNKQILPTFQKINKEIESKSDSTQNLNISPATLKNIAIGISVVLFLLFSGIKGQEYYKEYQANAEIQRAEETRKKAVEEEKKAIEIAEKAKIEAEKQKLNEFLANVRKHIGKPALDLVLEPEVNRKFKDIFGSNLSAYENYFTDSASVVEGNGIIVGQGCIKATCDNNKSLVVIDTSSGEVYTAVVNGPNVKYYGVSEDNVSPEVKKWVIANKK